MASSKVFRQLNGEMARDPAVSQITLTLDPARWSKRKKNILIESLRSGVAACGMASARLVSDLTRAMGSETIRLDKWNQSIPAYTVRPEKLGDLIAYTCAWIKIRQASGNEPPSGSLAVTSNALPIYSYYATVRFMRQVEETGSADDIPLPNGLTPDEQRAFIKEYVCEPSEQETAAREMIISMIENNQPINVTYKG